MRELHIDIETFSPVNLKTCGAYRYAAECEIILLALSYDDGPVKLYDLIKFDLPEQVLKDLQDPNIIKIAHNAAFERACLSAYYDIKLPANQWRCSMVLSAMAGLPMGLDEVGLVLNLGAKKDAQGKALIKYFCIPCKPTRVNGGRVRNLPQHDPEKWQLFGRYNIQDVRAEKALVKALSFIKVPEFEQKMWSLDQIINDRGVKVHLPLVRNAIRLNQNYKELLILEAIKVTGLSNPNSVKALIKWLSEETDEEILNLQKANIPKLIQRFDSPIIKRVLTIREELSKTSVSKYSTMQRTALKDGRIKGLIQYCGAGRTWRFAGRLVQVQNLVRGKYHDEDMDRARELIIGNDKKLLELLYGAIPDTLSQLTRTAFIPADGHRFIVSDYSAIEARVIAWLAGERWRLEVFATHGKIYEASAAQMFKVPIESVTKSSPLRQKSKIAELALGYAGSVNALIKMGALDEGIKEKELKPLVDAWRAASPNIVKLWYDVDRAAKRAINTGEKVVIQKGISFACRNGYLVIGLPSGHNLYYYGASLVPSEFGVQIQYWGLDQVRKKWCKMRTYGGRLVENLCQAIARDCLVCGLYNLHKAGYRTVMHVHDESVNEVPIGWGSLEEVNELMIKPAPWMAGLPLRADGLICDYYKKD